jgi:hypothetical protein
MLWNHDGTEMEPVRIQKKSASIEYFFIVPLRIFYDAIRAAKNVEFLRNPSSGR